MVTYRIRYEAGNSYQHVVQEALFEFLVLPCENNTQAIKEVEITNSLNRPVFRAKNSFGYDILCFRVDEPFIYLGFTAACLVEKQENILPSVEESLSQEEEQQVLRSEDFLVDHYLHIMPTDLTRLPEGQIPETLLYQKDQPLFSYVNYLNQSIYGMMEYQSGVTTFTTPATKVLANPRGVCQDYTHLMLGILRQQKFPCRYVSGYLNQDKGQAMMGSAQTHAWLEAFVPNIGWVGFDPTNNRMTDEHHIKIADGLDYRDCSPLKGHIRPGVENQTNHIVHVVEQ
ncbi:transglutaminase-like domain-containing protein [Tunicatimonas pelagia]|uniref:transglutaminase-like domain-containing protein n=1 Tax=Tunicatimonas pelagia TaxID=931531 RepID=UPI002667066A|nr:transglutaminase family protein [Tunicatimonas pelagia]WKN40945.1 transglutaminase family protein [Tunicatimonas pelagia]